MLKGKKFDAFALLWLLVLLLLLFLAIVVIFMELIFYAEVS